MSKSEHSSKVARQIAKAKLPQSGTVPFAPRLRKNALGEDMMEKRAPVHGTKRGKMGFVDQSGRIWIRDRAHAGVPDHWDVQEDDGKSYFRVDDHGDII